MPELSPDELEALLAKLDGLVRQAQELQAQIKARMADEKRRDQKAVNSNWSDRRRQPAERRKRQPR